jgi:uncharacterized protein (TIGR02246 family)
MEAAGRPPHHEKAVPKFRRGALVSARNRAESPARTPETLQAIIEDAFNRGDLDAYATAYEEDATLVVPPDGQPVHGRDAIRAATAPMFALQPRMTIVVRKKLETDGLALIRTRWQLVVTDDDGNRREMNGRATVVSRRRADGTWGIVFDDPLSAA